MSRFSKLGKSRLFQVAMLNNTSILIRMATGVITAKLLAIFVGPSGLAMLGNFRNFLASLESLTTMGFNQGIVKMVAENKWNSGYLRSWFFTVFSFLFVVLLSVSIGLYTFHERLAGFVFGSSFSSDFGFLFVVLAISFPLQVFNGVFVAVLNGLGYFNRVIYINILGNLIGFGLTALLLWKWELEGGLIALIIAPALTFIWSFLWVRKRIGVKWGAWSFNYIKPLFSFSIMAFCSALLLPVTFFYVRSYLIHNAGLEAAGYWEALQRISGFYLMFATTLGSVYFLPKLSIASDASGLRSLIGDYLGKVLPFFVLGLVVFYVWREWLIKLLLDDSFLPVADLLLGQLVGDFLKAFSLIFGIVFYAKKLVLPFIITEVLFYLVFYFATVYFVDVWGLVGVTIAHAVGYFVYALVLVLYFRLYLRKLN